MELRRIIDLVKWTCNPIKYLLIAEFKENEFDYLRRELQNIRFRRTVREREYINDVCYHYCDGAFFTANGMNPRHYRRELDMIFSRLHIRDFVVSEVVL